MHTISVQKVQLKDPPLPHLLNHTITSSIVILINYMNWINSCTIQYIVGGCFCFRVQHAFSNKLNRHHITDIYYEHNVPFDMILCTCTQNTWNTLPQWMTCNADITVLYCVIWWTKCILNHGKSEGNPDEKLCRKSVKIYHHHCVSWWPSTVISAHVHRTGTWRVWIIIQFQTITQCLYSWWRHPIETLSALVAFWDGNPPATGGFPSKRASNAGFCVFFGVS